MLRAVFLCLALAAPPVRLCLAAPLPEDASLDTRVTLSAGGLSIRQALARLSEEGGVTLYMDAHAAGPAITLEIHDARLRDVMQAIAGTQRLDWRPEEGGYRLTAPAIYPPPLDTRRLLTALVAAMPSWMRPPPTAASRDLVPPPLEIVYAALTPVVRDAIEDGEDVPFTRLPRAARQAIVEWRQENARRAAAEVLRPAWDLPAERLALRLTGAGASGATWEFGERVPKPPPGAPNAQPPGLQWPTDAEGWIWGRVIVPYQPLRVLNQTLLSDPKRKTSSRVAAEVARAGGASLVVPATGALAAAAPEGEGVEARLASLIPEYVRGRTVWRRAGDVYWREYRDPLETLPTWESERCRQTLERTLPAEYRPLFALKSADILGAPAGPWVRLWESLTEEQRRPGARVAVPDLSPQQQAHLLAALQAGTVASYWLAVLQQTAAGVEDSVLRLDMAGSFSEAGLGMSRRLLLVRGEETVASQALTNQPPLLRLLPALSPALSQPADLRLQEQPLAALAEQLSQALKAPVAVEEPEREVRLTADLREKPIRLLLHWAERHTGMQWCLREGAYVLAAPMGPDLAADPTPALGILEALAPPAPTGPVRPPLETMTAEDRAALQAGPVRFADLGPGLQEEIRNRARGYLGSQLRYGHTQRGLVSRLSEARLRLVTPQSGPRELNLDVPGLPTCTLTYLGQ